MTINCLDRERRIRRLFPGILRGSRVSGEERKQKTDRKRKSSGWTYQSETPAWTKWRKTGCRMLEGICGLPRSINPTSGIQLLHNREEEFIVRDMHLDKTDQRDAN